MKRKGRNPATRRKLRGFAGDLQPYRSGMECEKYKAVFEEAADFIYVIDRRGRFLSVNESATELCGRATKEIEGKSIFDIFPEEVATEYSKRLDEVFKTGKGRFDPDKRIVVGGKELWTSTRLDPIVDSEGKVSAVLGVSRDITERKRIEEALRRQTDLLLAVFNNAKGAIFILDAQNPPRILDCNRAASEIFGYQKSEMLGRTTALLHVNDESLKQFQSQLYPAMEKGLSLQLREFRMRRKDGSVFPTEHSVSQLLNGKGERTGWVSVVRDITERKRFEEELRALALFPSENPNPILRLDKCGTVLSANEASSALLQEWDSGIGMAAPKQWRDLVTAALSSGEDRNIDVELLGKSYTVLVKPITGAGYVNLYGRDITDRKRMEAQLAYQANLLATVNDAVVASDENFNITSWNQAAERIYGWKAKEVLGRKGPELLQTQFIGIENSEVFRQLAETGEWRGELIHRAKNGKPIYMESASITLRDKVGRITGYVAVNRDITDRKRAEERLRENEEKYEAIVQNSPDIIGIIQDGILRYINEAGVGRLGWSYEELTSPSFDPIDNVIAERYRDLIRGNVAKRLRGEDPPAYEVSLLIRGGSEIPVIVRGARIIYEGKPAAEFVFTDITEPKRLDEELRRSSQFLESIVENANVWLDVLDEEKNVVIWNKAAETISGYSRGEVVGHRKIWEWLYPDEEYRKQITGSVTDVLQHGRTEQNVETSIKRKDGQTRTISWNERNLLDKHGKVIGSIAIGRDITEQVQYEAKLRALHQHALQLSSSRDLDDVVKYTLDAIEFTMGFDCAYVFLVEDNLLRIAGGRGRPVAFSSLSLNGRGLTVKVAKTKSTIRVSDTTKEPDYVDPKGYDWPGPHTLGSELIVPVLVDGESAAVIAVDMVRQDAFTDLDQQLLETLSFHVASALKRLRQEKELKNYSEHLEEIVDERTKELATLDSIVLEITKLHELPTLLRTIVEGAVGLLGAEGGAMYFCEPEQQIARCVVAHKTPTVSVGLTLKYGEGAAGTVATTGKPLIINDYRTWPGRSKAFGDDAFRAILSVPMTWQGQVIGVIHVISNGEGNFTEDDLRLLTRFANHAAIAVGRQRAEQERRRLHDRLLVSERLAAIGETAAMVGHDLRNPLQGIAGATFILKKRLAQQADRTVNEMLQTIDNGVEHSNSIIGSLLEYSKEIELHLTETTPQHIVKRAITAIRLPGNIHVRDLSEDRPRVTLDQEGMQRVLVNLLQNAIEAMPNGGDLTISSRQTGDEVEIGVTDTGVGIPSKHLEEIWKPLHTTKAKGIGLGLPICKRIIEAHGGSVSVVSAAGRGSTFTVTLPIKNGR